MFSPLTDALSKMRVVLATEAQQKRQILEKTNINFETIKSGYAEDLKVEDYSFEDYVQLTAKGKVEHMYEYLKNDKRRPDLIIGLDTMVLNNNKLLGKPKDKSEAIEMLTSLSSSGIPNEVLTGVSIYYKGQYSTFFEPTKVYMETLNDAEIRSYVETREPLDKAGGYAIQGLAASFIKKIEGDYYNVMGMPLCRLTRELKKIVLK